MLPIQNGLICWLDASDGKVGETLLKDRTSYGHNLVLENFQQGYGFTGKSIKVKKSDGGSTIGNALYIANGGFKTHCKSFCLCIERNNTSEPWYIFDGRGLSGQDSGANHCFNGNTGESYNKSKTRKDGILTQYNAKLETDKKVYLYFELNTAELFTLSILMRYTKNESPEGQFYSLYAYNRALTEQEILHNMEYEKNKIRYVNDKNLPKIVEKLSDASNIKITGNKYGNRVQTVIDKIVEKADNVTKAISQEVINNTHSFKAGIGNNVNVSSDVQVQDSFSEIAIKGQTYQNLVKASAVYGQLSTFYFIDKSHEQYLKPNTQYTMILYPSSPKINSVYLKQGTTRHLDLNSKNMALFTTINNPNSVTEFIHFYTNRDATLDETKNTKVMLLEGDHTNNPNLPSYFEGIVGVGDENKNLLLNSNKTVGENSTTEFVQFTDIAPIFDKYGLIPYTISFDIKSKDTSKKNIVQVYGQNGSNSRHTFTEYVKVTTDWQRKHVTVIPTLADSSIAATMLAFYGEYNTGNIPIIKNFQIEKGFTPTLYKPYNDKYTIEVLNTGKSLFNDFFGPGAINAETGSHANSGYAIRTQYIKINKDSDYTLSGLTNKGWSFVAYYDYNGDFIGRTPGGLYDAMTLKKSKQENTNSSYRGFYIPENCSYIKITSYRSSSVDTTVTSIDLLNDSKLVQLEESRIATSYEPYKQDSLEFLLDQPLMKLPNGVYDEITKDGKLIRRIGKIVLNGSENWYAAGALDQTKKYFTANNLINNMKQIINSKFDDQISNNLLIDNPYSYPTKSCIWALWQDQVSKIRISVSNIQDVDGIKAWLKQNQTTLYYELQNPIIKDLSNNQIKLFKDGHLTFNTVVAPESSHIVQLNKSAQIQNTIKQSQLLDNKIAVLENNYDSLMLSTMSTLNDLEFDYTLK